MNGMMEPTLADMMAQASANPQLMNTPVGPPSPADPYGGVPMPAQQMQLAQMPSIDFMSLARGLAAR